MNDIAIRAEGLGKLYHIGAKKKRYKTFVDAFSGAVSDRMRRIGAAFRSSAAFHANGKDTFWALKDVSFEIKHGEVVGVIGRNGAGKSTLLKILSRITEPTCGFAGIHGRVGSLLEVGTGFHQELTGRENIYLNGAILGMRKAEIERKFDEIVAFSEVEKFIDTQVKHYSSGMKMRLAFSVAAHLEPEILIVDEVLAVGDAAFQKKCLGKMGDVAREGRTVLFVSHNIPAVEALCSRAIVLEEGTPIFDGDTQRAIEKYLTSAEQMQLQSIDDRKDRVGGKDFRFADVQFLNPDTMTPWNVLASGQPVMIRITYRSSGAIDNVGITISFSTAAGTHLLACRSRALGVALDIRPGKSHTDCLVRRWPLKGGRYTFNLFAERNERTLDYIKEAGAIDVKSGNYYGTGCLPAPELPGVLIDYAWEQPRNGG